MQQIQVIIIGSGLSGLALAYRLKEKNIESLILEARGRYGGRILTIQEAPDFPLEMGATWFGDQHQHLKNLLIELNLGYFPQHMQGKFVYEENGQVPPKAFDIPEITEPSYRIKGGTGQLIEALVEKIGKESIKLNTQVKKVLDKGSYLELRDQEGQSYVAQRVVSTLPPYLFGQSIQLEPGLAAEFQNLLNHTHTWMGDSIKFGLSYETPFWRVQGLSGAMQSPYGLATEMYDHSNFEDQAYALKGFLRPEAAQLSKEVRLSRLLDQLARIFGDTVRDYQRYTELLWSEEPYTYQSYGEDLFPHLNNGNTMYQKSWMEDKLIISGTETSPHYGGYMEGAIFSAYQALDKIWSYAQMHSFH